MTGKEKFALAKALHDAQMTGYPPQAQAWIRQQYTCIANGIVEELRLSDSDARRLRALMDQDNWTTQDNPFRDDPPDGQHALDLR